MRRLRRLLCSLLLLFRSMFHRLLRLMSRLLRLFLIHLIRRLLL